MISDYWMTCSILDDCAICGASTRFVLDEIVGTLLLRAQIDYPGTDSQKVSSVPFFVFYLYSDQCYGHLIF